MRAAFARFDRNRSGFLDYRELRNALTHMGLDLSTSTAVELVRAYDDYPDGKLDILGSGFNTSAGLNTLKWGNSLRGKGHNYNKARPSKRGTWKRNQKISLKRYR